MVSSGPYMFETYELGQELRRWSATRTGTRRPTRTARRCRTASRSAQRQRRRHRQPADRRRPRRRHRGHRRAAGRAGARSSPTRRSRRTPTTRSRRAAGTPSINAEVAPLDNIHCRKAVQYAADQTGYQRAYGGAGRRRDRDQPRCRRRSRAAETFDLYPTARTTRVTWPRPRTSSTQCGQPNGFATNIAYRADRPKEKAVAEALQQSLARVGIKLTLKPYPPATTSRSTPASRTSRRRTTSA